ncbi:MAG: type III pantothenate kinase, partial [Bacteroidota bacterium]|nr:type III pantothenate kinase [Bacteroidota bacterium]
KLPIQLHYETLITLGKDRIANAVGAHFMYSNTSNLVIDLGTCITYDFIDNRGVFQGGAISPGMGLRYKSLNQYTATLPLVNPAGSTPKLIGKSTEKSIQSGVENGVLFEVIETINQYKAIFKELNVLITGGDSLLIKSIVEYEKNGIFAVENLTLIGLNQILKETVKA